MAVVSLLSASICLLAGLASGGETGLAVSGRADHETTSVRVHLQGTPYTAISRQDGTFTIHNVLPGVYTLEVIDPASVWPQLELDVGVRQPGRVQAFSAARKEPLPYPLLLEPALKADYFEKREGFNPRGMLMNPMVLMMGFSLFSVVLLPQLMKNIDPESLKEMQETQKELLGGGGRSGGAVEDKSAAARPAAATAS